MDVGSITVGLHWVALVKVILVLEAPTLGALMACRGQGCLDKVVDGLVEALWAVVPRGGWTRWF